ncbi:hypothetical protein VS28_18530, partial [Vibrio cholerae O1 biovar El Tor]
AEWTAKHPTGDRSFPSPYQSASRGHTDFVRNQLFQVKRQLSVAARLHQVRDELRETRLRNWAPAFRGAVLQLVTDGGHRAWSPLAPAWMNAKPWIPEWIPRDLVSAGDLTKLNFLQGDSLTKPDIE